MSERGASRDEDATFSGDLGHAVVAADGATPTRYVLFLHGILGSGSNWRSFARRLVAARPTWGAVLVDLRLHGASQQGFTPPHTLAACAGDLERLEARLDRPVAAVLGHSFGGKVALEWAARRRDLEVAWILDSSPGARPDARGSEATVRIVRLLETTPARFERRESFVEHVLAHGVDRPTAMWLAMNLRAAPDGSYALRVDLPALRALLDDYFARDEWPVLEDANRETQFHLVVGGRSSVLDAEELAHAERLARDAALRGRIHLHVLPDAGHWVHVDAPDALFDLVAAATP
jgi:esterase